MKYSLRALIILLVLSAMVLAYISSKYASVKIELGMKHARVVELLEYLGAEDITAGMSVNTIDDFPPPEGPSRGHTGSTMWHVSRANITIETVFEDDQLIALNLWDWSGRVLDRYHRLMEYDSISELRIPMLHRYHHAEILETHNIGKNPPARHP